MEHQSCQSKQMPSHQRFGSQITFWNELKKTKLYIALVLMDIALFIVWILFVKIFHHDCPHVSFASIDFLFHLILPLFSIFCLFLLLLNYINALQQKYLDIVHYLLMFLHCLHILLVGHFFGQFGFIAGVSVGSAIFWSLLLLKRSVAYLCLLLNVLIIFGSQLVSQNLNLPYASIYFSLNEINSSFWIISSLFLVLVKVIIIVVLGDAIINSFKERHQKLSHISEHDDLTGLLNRRSIKAKTSDIIKLNDTVSFLLLDIDNFKHINDNYGHITGDSVICLLADLLKDACPDNALISRYGGEEFLICLQDTDIESAKLLADQLLMLIRQTTFKSINDWEREITVSIGIASSFINPQPKNKLLAIDQQTASQFVEKLMHSADIALIQAKNAGKNKFVSIGVICL